MTGGHGILDERVPTCGKPGLDEPGGGAAVAGGAPGAGIRAMTWGAAAPMTRRTRRGKLASDQCSRRDGVVRVALVPAADPPRRLPAQRAPPPCSVVTFLLPLRNTFT